MFHLIIIIYDIGSKDVNIFKFTYLQTIKNN